MRETADEHAPDVPADERGRLCREKATLMALERRASFDVWCDLDGSGPGRGIVVEKEVERDGETITVDSVNPALRAEMTLSRRQQEIATELRLWPGCRTND